MKLNEFGPRGGARPKFYYVDPPLKESPGQKSTSHKNGAWLIMPKILFFFQYLHQLKLK